jgi:putative endonuclease
VFYSYVIRSSSTGNLYKGHTDDLARRIEKHNRDSNKYYTGKKGPWMLIFSETFGSRGEAVKREKFYKSGKGREFLKQICG